MKAGNTENHQHGDADYENRKRREDSLKDVALNGSQQGPLECAPPKNGRYSGGITDGGMSRRSQESSRFTLPAGEPSSSAESWDLRSSASFTSSAHFEIEEDWHCPQCSYRNAAYSGSQVCALCGSRRPPKTTPSMSSLTSASEDVREFPTMSERRPRRLAGRFAVSVPYESSSKLSTSTSSFSSKSTEKASNIHHKKPGRRHSHNHKSSIKGQAIPEEPMKERAHSENDASLMMKQKILEDEATKPPSMPRRPSWGLAASTAPESSSSRSSNSWKPPPAADIVIPIPQDDSSSSNGKPPPAAGIVIPVSQGGSGNSNSEMGGADQPTAPTSRIAVDTKSTLQVENGSVENDINHETPNSKHYFKRCSKRTALLVMLLFIVAIGGAIAAVFLLLIDSDSGNTESSIGGQSEKPVTSLPVTPVPTTAPGTGLPVTLGPTAAPATPYPTAPITPSPTRDPNESLSIPPGQSTPVPTVITKPPLQESFEPFGSIQPGPGLQGFGSALSISRNGQLVAVAARNSNTVQLYRYIANGSGKWELTLQQRFSLPVISVAVSGDGSTLAVGTLTSVIVYRHDSVLWTPLDEEIPHAGFSVAFSNDGTFLAVGSFAEVGTFTIRKGGLEWKEIEYVRLGDRHEGGTTVSVTGDGTLVAVGSLRKREQGRRRNRVAVYDSRLQLIPRSALQFEETSRPPSISISEDGSRLAIGTNSNFEDPVFVYSYSSMSNGWVLSWVSGLPAPPRFSFTGTSVSMSDSGNVLAIASGDDIARVYRFQNLSQSWEPLDPPLDVEDNLYGSSIMLSGDGGAVAVGDVELRQVNLFKLPA